MAVRINDLPYNNAVKRRQGRSAEAIASGSPVYKGGSYQPTASRQSRTVNQPIYTGGAPNAQKRATPISGNPFQGTVTTFTPSNINFGGRPTPNRIQDIFNKYEVPLETDTESSLDRIMRIKNQIDSRERTWGDLERSVERLGTISGVEQAFQNAGVRIGTPQETAQERLGRIAQEIMSGGRTWDNLANSLSRLSGIPGERYEYPDPSEGTDVWRPFDPEIAAIRRRLQEQRGLLQSQFSAGQQRINEDYQTQTDELGRQRTDAIDLLQDQLAGQGILKSGINLEEQGEIGQDYQRFLGQLGQMRNRSLEDLQGALSQGLQGVASEEQRLAFEEARLAHQQQLEEAQRQAELEAARESQKRLEEMIQQIPEVTREGRIVPKGSKDEYSYLFQRAAPAFEKAGMSYGTQVDASDLVKLKDKLGVRVGKTWDEGDIQRIMQASGKKRTGKSYGGTDTQLVKSKLGINPGSRMDTSDWKRAAKKLGFNVGSSVDPSDIARIRKALRK